MTFLNLATPLKFCRLWSTVAGASPRCELCADCIKGRLHDMSMWGLTVVKVSSNKGGQNKTLQPRFALWVLLHDVECSTNDVRQCETRAMSLHGSRPQAVMACGPLKCRSQRGPRAKCSCKTSVFGLWGCGIDVQSQHSQIANINIFSNGPNIFKNVHLGPQTFVTIF